MLDIGTNQHSFQGLQYNLNLGQFEWVGDNIIAHTNVHVLIFKKCTQYGPRGP